MDRTHECWANKRTWSSTWKTMIVHISDNLSVKNRVHQDLPVSVWMFLVYSESSVMTNTPYLQKKKAPAECRAITTLMECVCVSVETFLAELSNYDGRKNCWILVVNHPLHELHHFLWPTVPLHKKNSTKSVFFLKDLWGTIVERIVTV